MVVAILLATAMGGSYLAWSYLKTMQMADLSGKTYYSLNSIVNNAIRRTEVVLTQGTANCPGLNIPPSPGWPGPATDEFRNFGQQLLTPLTAPITASYTCAGGSPDPDGLVGCLLQPSEVAVIPGGGGPLNIPGCPGASGTAGTGPVARLTLTLRQVGPPDPNALVSTVDVTVTASTTSGAQGFHSVSQTSRISLQVASLSSYNLVLTGRPPPVTLNPNCPAGQQLCVANKATFEIKGRVLYADSIAADNPLPLRKNTGNSVIGNPAGGFFIFDDPWDIQEPSFDYENAGTAQAPQLDMNAFSQVFKMGINSGVMPNVVKLPVYDPGPACPLVQPGMSSWEQQIDYTMSAAVLTAPPPGNPAPPPPAGKSMYPVAAPPTGDVTGFTPYNGGAGYSGGPGLLPAAVPAKNTIPVPPPAADVGIKTLDYSCGNAGPPYQLFVFQRVNDDLNIDFTGTSPLNAPFGPGAGTPVFCGLIAARNVVINAPLAGTMYYVFGLIIAQTVTVVGNGTVILVNPLENSALPVNPLPGGQTQPNLAQEMTYLAGWEAHNFFVPIFQPDPATLPAPGNPLLNPINAYRPHCPFRDSYCCGAPWTPGAAGAGSASDPTDVIDKAGYICPCKNGAGLATCDASLQPAAPDGKYCQIGGGTAAPSGADNTAQILSPVLGYWKDLEFTYQVVQ